MKSRCGNCMKLIDGYIEAGCPYCGYLPDSSTGEEWYLYPGTVLANRYTIGTVAGHGGFGIVYRAWDNKLNIMIAVKEFFPHMLVNRIPGQINVILYTGERETQFQHTLTRFLKEAKIMSRFNSNPNLVNIYDYFEENNTAYITMEFLHGISLKEYLKSNEITIDYALKIINDVSSGVKALHDEKILHRDISPDNIYLCDNGNIKLIDFGAALIDDNNSNSTLSVILKHGYAPPEQYRKKGRQGTWTDIYALGVVLYRMLAGQVPQESIDRLIKDDVKKLVEISPSIPESLDRAVMKAMALEPEFRFQNVDHFIQSVNQSKQIKPVEYPEDEARKKKSNKFIVVSGLCTLVVTITVCVIISLAGNDSSLNIMPDTLSIGLSSECSMTESVLTDLVEEFTRKYKIIEINIVGISDINDINIKKHDSSDDHFIPLGWTLNVIYANTYAADLNNLVLPDNILSSQVSALIDSGMLTEDNYDGFVSDRYVYYSGKADEIRQIQDINYGIAGRYQVIPIIPLNGFEVIYTDGITINKNENVKASTELFISYLLSEEGQTIIHRRNDNSFPVNDGVYDEYIKDNMEFYFVKEIFQ